MEDVIFTSLNIARTAVIEKLQKAGTEKRFQSGERTIQSLLADNNYLSAEVDLLKVDLAIVRYQNQKLNEKIEFSNDPMGKG